MTFPICVGERFFALDRHFWIEIHFMHDLVVITTVCHYQRTNQANVKSKKISIQSLPLCNDMTLSIYTHIYKYLVYRHIQYMDL